MRRFLPLVLLLSLPLPAAAQLFISLSDRELPRLEVVPLDAANFEVIEDHGQGGRGMWCTAGEYARDTLGVATRSRLYVRAARGASRTRPGRAAVVFTTDPAGLDARQSYTVSVRQPGLGLSVGMANTLCRNPIARDRN